MEPRETLRDKVLALPDADRAILLDELLSSIDPEKTNEIERAWAEIADERFHAYKAGDMEGISVEESRRRLTESRSRTRA